MIDLFPDTLENQGNFIQQEVVVGNISIELNLNTNLFVGTEFMNCVLLEQYKNSQNLITYISCFVTEMNILFSEMEKMYFGRMLDYAEGYQLDVIGRILQVNRKAVIIKDYFGFEDVDNAGSFSELLPNQVTANPSVGEKFRGLSSSGFRVLPLQDLEYSKLLKARAFCVGQYNRGIDGVTWKDAIKPPTADFMFKVVSLLFLGSYASYTTDNLIVGFTEDNKTINITTLGLLEAEVDLLYSIKDWFIPTTRELIITNT